MSWGSVSLLHTAMGKTGGDAPTRVLHAYKVWDHLLQSGDVCGVHKVTSRLGDLGTQRFGYWGGWTLGGLNNGGFIITLLFQGLTCVNCLFYSCQPIILFKIYTTQ